MFVDITLISTISQQTASLFWNFGLLVSLLNCSSSDDQLSSNGERLGYMVSENMNIRGLYFAHILVSLRDNPQFCFPTGNLQTSNNILHP